MGAGLIKLLGNDGRQQHAYQFKMNCPIHFTSKDETSEIADVIYVALHCLPTLFIYNYTSNFKPFIFFELIEK